MKPLPKVRFVMAWQTYRVGDVIEPNGTLRDWLIRCGYVVMVDTPPTPTVIVPAPDPALAKRRGRPRKEVAAIQG